MQSLGDAREGDGTEALCVFVFVYLCGEKHQCATNHDRVKRWMPVCGYSGEMLSTAKRYRVSYIHMGNNCNAAMQRCAIQRCSSWKLGKAHALRFLHDTAVLIPVPGPLLLFPPLTGFDPRLQSHPHLRHHAPRPAPLRRLTPGRTRRRHPSLDRGQPNPIRDARRPRPGHPPAACGGHPALLLLLLLLHRRHHRNLRSGATTIAISEAQSPKRRRPVSASTGVPGPRCNPSPRGPSATATTTAARGSGTTAHGGARAVPVGRRARAGSSPTLHRGRLSLKGVGRARRGATACGFSTQQAIAQPGSQPGRRSLRPGISRTQG